MLKTHEVQKALNDILAEFGGDKKTYCTYRSETGEPVCIIGHLLSRLEPEVFESLWYRDNPRYSYSPEGAQEYLEAKSKAGNRFYILVGEGLVTTETPELARRLNTLQWEQDRGTSWGGALVESGVLNLP